ncbi:hypothetical protein GH714_010885 [Hevea brasiliensis]|uniref:Uncharacterized protein n=1 Tax=Hevea brasiliensis TaxID=3981 RepID=A0A6A6N3T5_HEVBR|nr:hypothetical protein GH714_010885 [Hevea brasiliensis]
MLGNSGDMENGFSRHLEADALETGGLTIDNTSNLKDPMDLCMKFPALINSENDVKLPSCRDPVPKASNLRLMNDSKLGIRDDDDNFSRCNKPGTKPRAFRLPSRIGDRRIRKLLTSKYWKVAPKLKDCELSKVACLDGGMRPLYRKRKISNGVSMSSSIIGHQASFHSKDSHVKFSIKSFRIPEIFIEVPETATVGSLKRTVMEAVTAILGGGLRVGVLRHGKKVRDDNRTLLQTGISSKENLDTLGFTLEPSPVQAPPTVCTEDPPIPLPCDSTQLVPSSGNNIDSNHESGSSHTDKLADKTLSDSRALVPVPPVCVEALAVVPVNQKARRSELVQRRTRRPFSVLEVEALVQAVEELGTGRWRDVKLRSFENADHRTYVDLKDKWKTLVHTAKIAPQQRRGEPVPQELLDRVLAAHAYWSQHQAKQHGKNQAAVLKITETHGGRNGVEGEIRLF